MESVRTSVRRPLTVPSPSRLPPAAPVGYGLTWMKLRPKGVVMNDQPKSCRWWWRRFCRRGSMIPIYHSYKCSVCRKIFDD